MSFHDPDANNPRAQAEAQKVERFGAKNAAMICPHCQSRGSVRTKQVTNKKGVSGTKAAGAVLTLGWSLLATGLSRKEQATRAHCDACQNEWEF